MTPKQWENRRKRKLIQYSNGNTFITKHIVQISNIEFNPQYHRFEYTVYMVNG